MKPTKAGGALPFDLLVEKLNPAVDMSPDSSV